MRTEMLSTKGSMPQLAQINTALGHVSTAPQAEAGASLGDVFRTLRRRIGLVLSCAAACVLCSVVYLLIVKPVYEAAAIVRIDPGRAGSLGLSDLLAPGNTDTDAVLHTELSVLKSDGVALRTLRSLPDATFTKYAGESQAKAALPESVEALNADQQLLLNNFELTTDAKQVEGTSLINVTFRDNDPQVAATIVNNLVKAYVVQSFTSRDSSVAELRTWLSAQMATLKNQVDSAQKKLAEFQEANNILGTEGTSNTITDRLRLLNESLAASQAARIQKEALLRAASSGDPSTLANLFPDPSLMALQQEQGALYARTAQLSAKFGPSYPPLIDLKKQLATVNSELATNVDSVRHRLQQDYDAAKANQDMLQREYDAQTRVAYGINRNQAEYAVLQGDVTSSRDLYDTLRRKLAQASVDADVNGVNTVLVDAARVPTLPVAPKKLLILLGSLILGLFAGVVAAFVGDAASDKLQSPAQIERLGYRVLGMFPRSSGRHSSLLSANKKNSNSSETSLVTIQRPASQNAEAYRDVRNALLLSFPGLKLKKLVVTSALPGEGMSRAAANLAVSLAQAGYNVLAVDTDLRRPSLHLEFGVENTDGLSDYLMDGGTPARFTRPLNDLNTLCLLTAGSQIRLPSERLASATFRAMLQEWESNFDFVILQSAPLLIVSDGVPLASWADAVLLVTRYGTTKLRTLAQVQALLSDTQARVAGVLIDDVPKALLEHEAYGRADDVYFA